MKIESRYHMTTRIYSLYRVNALTSWSYAVTDVYLTKSRSSTSVVDFIKTTTVDIVSDLQIQIKTGYSFSEKLSWNLRSNLQSDVSWDLENYRSSSTLLVNFSWRSKIHFKIQISAAIVLRLKSKVYHVNATN